MDEFNRQLKNNLQSDIYEFNTKPEYSKIRELYKNNFDKIVFFIDRTNSKLAIEDIAGLDSKLAQSIFDNSLLLQQINKAISNIELTLNDIK